MSHPVAADTLVIHGERDDVVPLAAVLDWARPQALPITVVPGAEYLIAFASRLLSMWRSRFSSSSAVSRSKRASFSSMIPRGSFFSAIQPGVR